MPQAATLSNPSTEIGPTAYPTHRVTPDLVRGPPRRTGTARASNSPLAAEQTPEQRSKRRPPQNPQSTLSVSPLQIPRNAAHSRASSAGVSTAPFTMLARNRFARSADIGWLAI